MPAVAERYGTHHGKIMIVDDNPANLKLLEDMLRGHGYEIRSFPRGRLALAAAARNPPDLILLDINMPEMDGYEVCERLKANSTLAQIPVIFLSALSETQDKVKAFRAGGVDYIAKPFQFEEVQARVETHIKLHELQKALKLQNERLEEAVTARTRELAEANARLTILDHSKSDFLSLISHEFRTPLNGLLGIGEIILDEMPSTKEYAELRQMFEQSRVRILTILEDALLLGQIHVKGDQFRSATLSLNAIVRQAIARAAAFAAPREIALAVSGAGSETVSGNRDLLARALQSLIETAVKFSAAGETVAVLTGTLADCATVTIEATGRAIPASAFPKFFELFSIGEAITPGGDLGLGPPVARRILALFGGSVTVENRDSPGIRFIVSLRTAAAGSAE